MIQLRPREYFTIVRGLPDHTDAGTYYVQAVIRNAKTDVIIETVNLTDQGDRRFSYAWQVPADPSGEGFYVVITSTVYSDSGYSTKDPSYGEEFATYLIQDRINPNNLGPIGPDIDYKKIKKMVSEAVNEIERKEVEMPEKYDDSEVIKYLIELNGFLARLPDAIRDVMPAYQPTSLEPVLVLLKSLQDAVSNIKIPEQEELDLSPISGELESIRTMLETSDVVDAKASLKKIDEWITKFGSEDMDELKRIAKELKDNLEKMPYVLKNAPSQEKPKSFNL